MTAAAVTMVYNENVNLPIWRGYYGAQLGFQNLFILDDGSTDGSTTGLPNVLELPRAEFDDTKRAAMISDFCASLLRRYDTVIYTDCDELVVPNLSRCNGLADYLERRDGDYVTCTGLSVLHILTEEPPLDLARPILQQRRYAMFRSAGCKPSVTRVPLRWSAGFHTCDRQPRPDADLFLFHLSRMDYTIASQRHQLVQRVQFSSAELGKNHGVHWRYGMNQFVREGFLDPMHALRAGVKEFDFASEWSEMWGGVVEQNGIYHMPMNITKLVEIPEHLRGAF